MNFPENFVFILFGATGDLAYKKLIPALYQAIRFNPELKKGHFICLGRSSSSKEEYMSEVKQYLLKTSHIDFQEGDWQEFCDKFTFICLDVYNPNDFDSLKEVVESFKTDVRIFYLSTSPTLFSQIVENLIRTGLNQGDARLVLEKPLGVNLETAQSINSLVGSAFAEKQIYRIDHYLGKESVQNLMALRFGNRFLEPLWNRVHIRSVQITLSEEIGVEARGGFYEGTGALRDMVQNHLLQLLCFVAMEPPYAMEPDAIRDEKLKVLRSLELLPPEKALSQSVFAQYKEGMIDGKSVPAYRTEKDVNPQSCTETFVALKMNIENWRWAGVPFYLRTGKRLAKHLAEIVVSFRSVPHHLFTPPLDANVSNKLVINLQPDDEMQLHIAAKPPGNAKNLEPVALNLNFAKQLNQRRPTAYERLLTDIIRGDISLFVRQDELEEAWRKMQPFLDVRQNYPEKIKFYASGSWGPVASQTLLVKDQSVWHEGE